MFANLPTSRKPLCHQGSTSVIVCLAADIRPPHEQTESSPSRRQYRKHQLDGTNLQWRQQHKLQCTTKFTSHARTLRSTSLEEEKPRPGCSRTRETTLLQLEVFVKKEGEHPTPFVFFVCRLLCHRLIRKKVYEG